MFFCSENDLVKDFNIYTRALVSVRRITGNLSHTGTLPTLVRERQLLHWYNVVIYRIWRHRRFRDLTRLEVL